MRETIAVKEERDLNVRRGAQEVREVNALRVKMMRRESAPKEVKEVKKEREKNAEITGRIAVIETTVRIVRIVITEVAIESLRRLKKRMLPLKKMMDSRP